jgi:hypothetical protein
MYAGTILSDPSGRWAKTSAVFDDASCQAKAVAPREGAFNRFTEKIK